jgi:hypothetical protein
VQLQQYTCNGTGAQQYDFVYVGNSQYEIHNANSGLCLDLAGSNTNNGTAVQQYTCNGTGAQHWTVSGNGEGSVTIRSSYNYNKVVDVSGASLSAGAKLQIYDSNGGGNQHYQMTKVVYQAVLADGTYNIVRKSNGQCWDVPSSSTSAGVQIQTYSCNGTQAQQFDVTHVGGGYYTIVNVNSALGVAINDYSLGSGATVVQNNPHAGDNQLFTFVPYGGGYIIRPKNSYMCVDVDEAFLFGNDQLQQYTCNQTSNQIFTVRQIPDSAIPSYLQCH